MPEDEKNRGPETELIRNTVACTVWDLDNMVLELESQQKYGKRPVRLDPLCWWMEKRQTAYRHFQLACPPTGFDPEEPETAQKLAKLKADTGWELVSHQGRLLAFGTEREDPPPLFPDLSARRENLLRGTRSSAAWGCLLVAVLLVLSVLGVREIIRDPVAVFSNNPQLYLAQLWPTLTLFFGAELVSRLVWSIRSAGEARRGVWLPTTGHNRLLSYLVFFSLFIVPAVHLSGGGPIAIVTVFVMVALVLLLLLPVARLRAAIRRRGRTPGLFTALLLPMLLSIGVCWGAQQLTDSLHNRYWDDPEPPVTVWALTGQSPKLYQYDSCTHSSLWGRDSYYESRVPEGLQKPGAASLPALSCRVVDTRQVSFTHDFAMATFRREGREQGLTARELDPGLAVQVIQLYEGDQPRGHYLIHYGTRTAMLHTSWLLTEPQLEQAVRNLQVK